MLDNNTQPPNLRYCLYARKSSEQDERQAMSIDSQVKEMRDLAERDGIHIVKVLTESHSAKDTGQRKVFNQLVAEIEAGEYDAILSWDASRLSRCAGDLGNLVDLMDQKKLLEIRTHSQVFTDNPNEKFLLMILCSQAKLENDNRGMSVKRGIRASCESGWRPCQSPLGYIHRTIGGVKDIVLDPDRAPFIREMFIRCSEGESGMMIKQWLDSSTMRSRNGKFLTKSMIYSILKNTYYYGEFEHPLGSGNWYKGKHPAIIDKELFEQVQEALAIPPRGKWGEKYFAFKGIARCKDCGAFIVGEEKFKKLKAGGRRRHVYYHCSRQVEYHCTQPFLREEDLIKQVVDIIQRLDYGKLKIKPKLKFKLLQYDQMTKEHIDNPRNAEQIFYAYTNYLLKFGDNQEKAEFLKELHLPFMLDNRHIYISSFEFNAPRRKPDRLYLKRIEQQVTDDYQLMNPTQERSE